MKMLELADGELELETMGLLMGKLMKTTPNITIQCDAMIIMIWLLLLNNNYLAATFYQEHQKSTKIPIIYWPLENANILKNLI